MGEHDHDASTDDGDAQSTDSTGDADAPSEEPPLSDLARRVARRRREEGTTQPPVLDERRDERRETASVDAATSDADPKSEAPLSGLARRVSERRERRRSEDASATVFEEMDVGEVDSETLWTTLVESDDDPEVRVGTGATATPLDGGVPGYADHLVSKAEFCQKCPYLTDPPDLGCERDGSEIVDVPDADHFRVRNCPMVGDDDL
jgi:hypothetical protein